METDSSVRNPDIELVTMDVKMQIRTLHAKVIFLQETGGLTEDVKQMITELTTLFNKRNLLSMPFPLNTSTPVAAPKLLLKAEIVRAHSEYTGPDRKHLLIMPGDTINIYAYINKDTAVGFNPQTGLGGRFPIDVAMKIEPQPDEKVEILICTSDVYGASNSLRYKLGQCVRVCRWETDWKFAYGFNHSTLAMGKFEARHNFTKVEWHKEN